MHDAAPGVVLQDLRSFTVQIRHAANDETVGTGIVASADGLVMTCDHVVRAAGVDPRNAGDAVVGVYFPRGPLRHAEKRQATIKSCCNQTDDDVVLLQLVEGILPLAPEQVATLGDARESSGHRFESYGYRRLDRYRGGRAAGIILGDVEAPEGSVLLLDPVQLESSQIDSGMSGSAVLDVERNLVVGIISETWFPGASPKDRDTAWSVNAGVMGLSPFNLDLQHESLPLRVAPRMDLDPGTARRMVATTPGVKLDSAPPALPEWVGRDELLAQLTAYWREDEPLIVGLVGLGGEGKTSLARRWIDDVLGQAADLRPDGVFWWTFRDGGGTDEFLEAAVDYMTGGRLDLGDYPSASARARLAAGLLQAKRYVVVLDGLELTQFQQGDQYGSFMNQDLRAFLGWFATPGHRSFCLLTSRVPVLDLAPYTTYLHVDVDAMSVVDGRNLLRSLRIVGSDAELNQVVRDWDGHALTLSLLASYLVKHHGGDVRRISTIPSPDPSQPRDQLVRRVLQEYDRHLDQAAREFLARFSIFRHPVETVALQIVLEDGMQARVPGAEAVDLAGIESPVLLQRLVASRIIRQDAAAKQYGMHPLIRDFYLRRGVMDSEAIRRTHDRIKRYYLATAPSLPPQPRIEDLAPLVEAAHHACGAEQWDEGGDIVYDRLYLGERCVLTRELGAYDMALSVILEFFPDGQLRREPTVQDLASRRWILNEAGTCLQLLGQLREAVSVIRRSMAVAEQMEDWHNAAVSCQNLVELGLSLGALPAASQAVRQAFQLAELARDKEDELVAQTLRGGLAHLRGRSGRAREAFHAGLELASAHTPIPALYSYSGIRYAEHLRRTGDLQAAQEVTRTNLRICERAGWQGEAAECWIVFGELAEDVGDSDRAAEHYQRALRIARAITRRDVLINSLLAWGRWNARWGVVEVARNDLDHALWLATLGGYRLAEIDIRVSRALLHRAEGDDEMAWREAERALQMSLETGYHWGQIDASAMLKGIDGGL
jgi:tetratricopeptide (TPR) repeat protein